MIPRWFGNLIEVIRRLDGGGVGFRALQDRVDAKTTGGKLGINTPWVETRND